MVLRITAILFTIVSVFGCTSGTNPRSGQTETEDSGKQLYLQNCKICHGEDGTQGAAGAKDLSTSDLTRNEIRTIIIDGKGNMPPFGYMFEEDTSGMNRVIDYVESLKKP